MDKAMKIAVILSAVDNMSNTVDGAVNKSLNSLQKFKPALNKIALGGALVSAGIMGVKSLAPAIKTFAEYQQAAANLKSNLMDRNGFLDSAMWQSVQAEAVKLGNLLPGNTADFYQMFDTLKSLGINTADIIGGVAKSAAYLSLVTGESYQATADAAGRMMNATGIAAKDMMGFFDTVARAQKVGVGLSDMKDAFANAAGQLKFLNIQGLDATKSLTGFFATIIRNGNSGQRVGTAFSRIMGEMLNPKHYNEMQAAAKKYGITLDILDKNGNFSSVDNMISQFQKLRTLSNFQVADVLKPLTGGTGIDDQIIKALSKDAGNSYLDVLAKMNDQASLSAKAQMQLATLTNQWERFLGTMDNVKAAIGASLQVPIDRILNLLNKASEALQRFVENNPNLSRSISLVIAVSSALLALAGTIKIIQGVAMAFKLLNITLLSGPVGWVIGIAAAVAATTLIIIRYWTQIKGFFVGWGHAIANSFKTVLGWMKTVFLYTNPIGWVILSWKPVMNFFSGFGQTIKNVFNDIIDWISGLWTRFMEAGKMIVKGLWAGIKAVIMWPINEIKKMMDNIKHVITFGFGGGHHSGGAMGIGSSIENYKPAYASTRSTSSNITYSPVINLHGGASPADATRINQINETHFEMMIKKYQEKQKRVSF